MSNTGETKVSVLVSLFNWIQKTKVSSKKKLKFRKFLDTYCDSSDYFSAVRLILPSLDRERGSYGLKESVLATCLIDALGMARDSEDALRLINWRKGNAKNAGNFPLVAFEVLQRRQGMISGGLTINELNGLLDRLASSESRSEKTAVLSTLIKKTNAQEMKWIIMIVLKDLKLGISEKSIFHEFHPDAEDLFNVTCDLKLVCEKLRDRSQRHKRQDIEVGKAVRPQLAMRVSDVHAAWKKLHGKEVVVECKFDGDRIQVHKNGAEVHYFSRNFLDHSEYKPAMSDIFAQNILVDRCILDGEMLVWDMSLNRFAEFGSNQEIAKAARDGLDSDRQLCYVAFDVLYVGDTSVIHQSLKERHELLKKVVRPLKGRLEILVPNGGLNTLRSPGEPCWSLIAYNMDDVEKFFKETIKNRDEGIVLKDLGSKWEPSDRSGKWLKLKPEYIHTGSDLDVLIIGGYYGSGRGGGEVTQFLVALAERPAPHTYPRRFISFCRVGSGLSDDELHAVVTKLKPYFRKNEYPKKAPPSFYQVTNNSKERPDVWIESPENSLILSITSDIRTITSEVFAAPYSLRFPRIDSVRYDKPWHECLDVQSFVELVHSSNGTTHKGKEYGRPQDKPKRVKSSRKGEKNKLSVVPSHLIQTDVSNIKGETLVFSNMMFYFINVPPTQSLDSLHKMVVENGGTFSMNLNNSVTHCIAAENKGIKFQAAKRYGDVIHYSWVLDCCSHKRLLPLQPKYFLHISDSSKTRLQEEVDEFSDSYFWDLDLADIKQLLSNIDRSEDHKAVDHYKKKYCPEDKWSLFHDCCIYLYCSPHFLKPEWGVLLGIMLRRLKIEVSFAGGKVCHSLAEATHLVVLSVPGYEMDFDRLTEGLGATEKKLLQKKRLHMVRSQWLEECVEREKRLQENAYSLRPSVMEESYDDLSEHDTDTKEESTKLKTLKSENQLPFADTEENQKQSKSASENSKRLVLPKRENDGKRKRGRPAGRITKRGKISINQPQRTRARVRGKNPSKISEGDSDDSSNSDEKGVKEENEMTEGNDNNHDMADTETSEIKHAEAVAESSYSKKTIEQQVPEDVEMGERYQGEASDKAEKLEVMVDPVQAMLLDMIPSLGMKKVEETTNTAQENEKPRAEEVNVDPIKKKKVSYKDVAQKLLKDW